jgi:hypothetical protein
MEYVNGKLVAHKPAPETESAPGVPSPTVDAPGAQQ